MRECDRLELVELIKKRIDELENALSDCSSVSDKKRSQAGDAAASLDLTINASVDEKILTEHRLELAQLVKRLAWIQTEDGGVCAECGCDIPVNRLKAVLSTRLCVVCADGCND